MAPKRHRRSRYLSPMPQLEQSLFQLGASLGQAHILPLTLLICSQAPCFLSLFPPKYKGQQSQPKKTVGLNLTPSLFSNTCPSTPEMHRRGAAHWRLSPTTWAHLKVLCWCSSSGKMVAFCRLRLVSPCRQDWLLLCLCWTENKWGAPQVGFVLQWCVRAVWKPVACWSAHAARLRKGIWSLSYTHVHARVKTLYFALLLCE